MVCNLLVFVAVAVIRVQQTRALHCYKLIRIATLISNVQTEPARLLAKHTHTLYVNIMLLHRTKTNY